MTRYHATSSGKVPFTSEEETARDLEEAEWAAASDARAAESVRSDREERLAKTDWLALSDTTMSSEWTTYRQALRDISAQAGFPNTITWPTKPGE